MNILWIRSLITSLNGREVGKSSDMLDVGRNLRYTNVYVDQYLYTYPEELCGKLLVAMVASFPCKIC